jgi:phage terminase small subunit
MAKKEKTAKGKELKFVYEYAKCWNGSEAYKIAFPNSEPRFAKQYAYRLLQKPYIQEAITKAVEEVVGPMEKDLTENVKFWINMRNDPNERAANRLKASEMLAKYRGQFKDNNPDVNLKATVQIVDDI